MNLTPELKIGERDSLKVINYHSPCGTLLLGEWQGKICTCDWEWSGRSNATLHRLRKFGVEDIITIKTPLLRETEKELDDYFKGERKEFDLPLKLIGTDFQREVWQTLLTIGYGETVSYFEVAQSIRRPSAVRAVANAIGANPLSILIPCHRVIASDGSLGGYAGSVRTKRHLLQLEKPLPFN